MHTNEDLAKLTPAIQRRVRVETRIVKQVVKDALAAGYELAVSDGEAFTAYTRNAVTIHKALMNTDEDWLYFRVPCHTSRAGWVRFVYGNDGPDVICDYTTNLEKVLTGANQLAEKMERGTA